MLSFLQLVIYALTQGITELFPISSVGHAVILPYVLGWSQISGNTDFLPFVVMLHLGTALALIIYFFKDWIRLIRSLFQRDPVQRKILGLIIAGTIPAAIIGAALQKKLTALFPSPLSAGLFLIVNGFVLFAADRMRKTARSKQVNHMSYLQAVFIGIIQAFALIPGFSRSGITMTAGLKVGLSYEESARFSFLLATPIILGAGILEVPKVLKHHSTAMLQNGLIGGVLSGIVALLCTMFLMRYFRQSEVKALRPFGYYCVVVGVIVSLLAAAQIQF